MSDPFIGEIKIFGCNFAPKGWAFCNGQLMPISQNTALFSLLGTNYGGDGRTTFGLPNLQGATAMHWGTAPSGTQYYVGQAGGEQAVTLLESAVPQHTHSLQASALPANLNSPGSSNSLARSTPATIYTSPTGQTRQPLAPGALTPMGGGQPHNNLMPYLTLNFCIALQGIYPPRT